MLEFVTIIDFEIRKRKNLLLLDVFSKRTMKKLLSERMRSKN